MSRSKWKGPYIKCADLKHLETKKNTHNIITRDSEILPKFLGLNFKIYNGKDYVELTVTDLMVGHKFGEFVFTRAQFSFKKKKSN